MKLPIILVSIYFPNELVDEKLVDNHIFRNFSLIRDKFLFLWFLLMFSTNYFLQVGMEMEHSFTSSPPLL